MRSAAPLAILLAALAACDDGGKPRPAPAVAPIDAAPAAAAEDAEAAPAEADPLAPPTAAAHHAGPAYLGVDSVGLMKLDGGKLTHVVDHAYAFSHIVVDAHGVVYATAIGGTWRIAGGKPQRLDDATSLPLEAMALGPDGVLWATDHQGVFRYDGAWTSEPGATFDNALLGDLAVDLDGRVWVVTSDALWRLDGDRWNRLDVSFAHSRTPYFDAIAVGADGAVYVTSLPGTFRFRDGRWSKVAIHGDLSLDELVAGPAGHLVASGGVGDLVIVAPGRAPLTRDLAELAQAHRGDAAAVDGAGRVWLTTDNGLVVVDDRGALVQQWLPGTVAGVTGSVTAVAVVGDGPTLPGLRAAAVGSITGKVLRAGKSVAGAAVQLCDMPLTMFQRTPCEGSTFSRTATTAADGTFRMDGVPIGGYGFAVRPGKTWFILMGHGTCCTALEEGGTYDIGSITVD